MNVILSISCYCGIKAVDAQVVNIAVVTSKANCQEGHFALEEDGDKIADHIRNFLTTHVLSKKK